MKRQVSMCVAFLVMIGTFVAVSQDEKQREDAENRLRSILEMIERVTAPNDVPRDLDTLLTMTVAFSPQVRQARAELDAIQIQIARDVSAAFAQRERAIKYLLSYPDKVEDNPREAYRYQGSYATALRESEEALRALTGLTLSQFPAINSSFVPMDPMGTIQTIRADRATQATNRTPEAFPTPDFIRAALEKPGGINFENTELREIFSYISDYFESQFDLTTNFSIDIALVTEPITISLKAVTLHQALQALADQHRNLVFVLRDYGIFVTTRERALRIPGPTIPDNVPFIDPNAK